MSNPVPTTAKEFEPWFAHLRASMPADLQAKGERALLGLKTVEQKAWKLSFAFRKAAKGEYSDFATDPRLVADAYSQGAV